MDPMGKDTLVIEGGIVLAFVEGIERPEVVVGKLAVEMTIPPHCY